MAEIVLDCSVTMAFFLKDEDSEYPDAVFRSLALGTQACVPDIWSYEVLNVLINTQRTNRLKPDDVCEILKILKAFPIRVHQTLDRESWESMISLAHTNNLSAYDAAYLDLAIKQHCPLATLDRHLVRAAHKMGVKVWAV